MERPRREHALDRPLHEFFILRLWFKPRGRAWSKAFIRWAVYRPAPLGAITWGNSLIAAINMMILLPLLAIALTLCKQCSRETRETRTSRISWPRTALGKVIQGPSLTLLNCKKPASFLRSKDQRGMKLQMMRCLLPQISVTNEAFFKLGRPWNVFNENN